MIQLNKFGIEAVSLYFSGTCNLQCTYCFQPKVRQIMGGENEKCINWITSGKMEDDILRIIGNGVKVFGLWGGEPTLNLPYLAERLPYIYEKFPELESIDLSTNISTKRIVENILNFLEKVKDLNEKTGRELKVGIQLSIDGPPEITDKDRIGCHAEELIENSALVFQGCKDRNIEKNISFSHKPTISAESLRWMLEPNKEYGDNLTYYYKWFDKHLAEWLKIGNYCPTALGNITLVYPGHYTQEDGFNYATIIKKLMSKEFINNDWKALSSNNFVHNQTTSRLDSAFSYLYSLFFSTENYKRNLYCSAGVSCIGLDYEGKIHLCQSTFFYNDELISKTIKDDKFLNDFEAGQGYKLDNYTSFFKGFSVFDPEDELRCLRFFDSIRTLKVNLPLKIQYLELMFIELAKAGQISRCYLEKEWRDLAIAFWIFGGNECTSDNLWEFGSLYVRDISHFRLIHNGAFEYLMNSIYKKGEHFNEL